MSDFAYPLHEECGVFGIAMGTFNSICFVPGLWVWWQKKRGVDVLKPTKKAAKAKA